MRSRALAAAVLLSAPLAAAGCTASRPDTTPAVDAMCEGQVPASPLTTQRGRVTLGQAVTGDLLRGDAAAVPLVLGEDVWVYAPTHDGPATVNIDFPRREDVWLTTRMLFGSRGFSQLGVAGRADGSDSIRRMTFRALPGQCYAFHVSTFESDTASRTSAYTLRVDAGSPMEPIRVGQTLDGNLDGGDQSRVQANESTIYYFEDWVIEDAGSEGLRIRMELAPTAEGAYLAVGTARADGSFAELQRVEGRTSEIVFHPEPGQRYIVRTEMSFREMDRRYRLTVERAAP